MREYHLHELTGDDHEQLVIHLCRDILGMGTVNFSEGPDGGRDGKFVGTAQKYPSSAAPWSGCFIIQSKRVSDPTKSCSDPDFKKKVLDPEIPKIKKLRENGECDAYLIFTNRKLAARTEPRLIQYIKDGTLVDNVGILGVETISSYLDVNPQIVSACGVNIFRGPLRIFPGELRDIIVRFHDHWHGVVRDAEAKFSFDHPGMSKKNDLNKLSSAYFDYMDENSSSYFYKIHEFLTDPKNRDLQEYYDTFADELRGKIIVKRDSFDKFEEVFAYLFDHIIDTVPELKPKRRLVNVFLHYMYCQCDIGRKK